jgi:hypothetical protein
VIAMIAPARTVGIAHALKMIGHAHLHPVRVRWHPVRRSRSLENIPHPQIKVNELLERLVKWGGLTF